MVVIEQSPLNAHHCTGEASLYRHPHGQVTPLGEVLRVREANGEVPDFHEVDHAERVLDEVPRVVFTLMPLSGGGSRIALSALYPGSTLHASSLNPLTRKTKCLRLPKGRALT